MCVNWRGDVNGSFVVFVSSAPAIKGSGECGVLYLAEPLDACSKLTYEVKPAKNGTSSFALLIRGGCTFEEKVRRAQEAGFKAAIVYDNEDGGALVASMNSPCYTCICIVYFFNYFFLCSCYFMKLNALL